METLNELAQLRDSEFGRPSPRHGLQLLYWFANDCITFDNNQMYSECDPAEGDFGFHLYENNDNLLPVVNYPYYVVGNLHKQGACELPSYVKTHIQKFSHDDNTNTDRVIVSLDNGWFDRVYVTEHINRTNYDPNATFRISRGLLHIIRKMNLEHFLQETGYYTRKSPQTSTTININTVIKTPGRQLSENTPRQSGFWDRCTIL